MFSGVTSSARSPSQTNTMTRRAVGFSVAVCACGAGAADANAAKAPASTSDLVSMAAASIARGVIAARPGGKVPKKRLYFADGCAGSAQGRGVDRRARPESAFGTGQKREGRAQDHG